MLSAYSHVALYAAFPKIRRWFFFFFFSLFVLYCCVFLEVKTVFKWNTLLVFFNIALSWSLITIVNRF